ncbi:sentrin-specific protease 1-like isoform X1 [Dermacentor albipictus]|uniref:sentrin-specific protease 1-like isoform X1 n=1 Tax=Dermacentor albipictus TaxID=60249 RepID=UPI0038FCB6C2
MVPRVETLPAGTSARDALAGTRGAYYESAVRLRHDLGFVGAGRKDVQEDNHVDWEEWISSVTVRYRTEALYRRSRPTRHNESCRGRPCFPWRKECAGLVTEFVDEIPRTPKMRTRQNECYEYLVFETNVGGCRRITRSLSGRVLRRSTREKTLKSIHASKLPESAASRRHPVGSADWFVALKKLLTEKSCFPKRQTKSNLVHDVVESPGITRAMQREVEAALVPTPADEVLVSAFRIHIRRADMRTLADGEWLNDEVINFYMNLLAERSKKEGYPRVYAFNTFFYPKLVASDYAGVKRWTRTVDLFSFDIALVPLYLGNTHWCLAAVDFRRRHIAYYDSLGPPTGSPRCLSVLLQYLECESRQRRNHGLAGDDWSLKVVDVPLQQNSNDCGMFACQYAECVSRDAPISFGQRNMPYFRKRVAYEILHKTMLSA